MNDHPQKPKDAARPVDRGNVFHLDKTGAMVTLFIIQVMFSIYNCTIRALIDIGGTNSFVSSEFVRNLTFEYESSGQNLIIEIASNGLLEAHVVYKPCRVKISYRELIVYLILINFPSFDEILGIN